MVQLPTSPQVLRERLAISREAARYAARESVALRAAVEQRLAESRACLRATAEMLRQPASPPFD